ncbi:hypothetical protein LMG28140_05511 [Paraburkholderia metrosideri]|uniref:Uncharacterized protein n=1 Tax=Paraburkholderia metrosideri TaxID=580937 RepID=A0ABN7I9Y2_9BURK|nr:hypothetical protein LMG28140_05511 [Paraburkholderia metrosideri]
MLVRFGATSKVTLWSQKKGSSFNHMAYGHREIGVRCPATLRETTPLGWTKAEWVYEFRAGRPAEPRRVPFTKTSLLSAVVLLGARRVRRIPSLSGQWGRVVS